MKKILTILLASILMLTGTLTAFADNGANVENFTDVAPTDYFYEPVKWAIENGITNGTSETTFSPDEECNVGQIMTFLWRAAGQPQVKTTPPLADANLVYGGILGAESRSLQQSIVSEFQL